MLFCNNKLMNFKKIRSSESTLWQWPGKSRALAIVMIICVASTLFTCAERQEDIDDDPADVNGPMPAKDVVVLTSSDDVQISWEIPTKEDSLFNRDIQGFFITRCEGEADEALPARTVRYETGDMIGNQNVVAIVSAEPTKDQEVVVTWKDIDVQPGLIYHYKIFTYDETPNYSDPFSLEAAPGSLVQPRTNQAQVLLADGRVLLCGGTGYGGKLDSAEIFDPQANSFEMLADSMNRRRTDHTATLLDDGTVLIAGGFDEVDEDDDDDEDEVEDGYIETLMSAEIFDPATGLFKFLDEGMTIGRGRHTATLLPDGSVLIVGGNDSVNAFDSAEIFHPETQNFTAVSDTMAKSRFAHSITSFYKNQEFRLLIAGGSNRQKALDSATFFNPDSFDFGRFDPISGSEEDTLAYGRMSHTATLTPGNMIALIGGFTGAPTAGFRIADIELFDIAAGEFLEMNPLATPRSDHLGALLGDGTILLAGGIGNGSVILSDSEIFDPIANIVSSAPPLNQARMTARLTILDDGRIFVAGGNGSADPYAPHPIATAEIYSLSTDSWDLIPSP
jgi:hypothetical protein